MSYQIFIMINMVFGFEVNDMFFSKKVDPGKIIHIDVKMDRSDPVVGNQACSVKAYDYYEPGMNLYVPNVCNI
jgi:hypothetical protein